MCPNLVRKQYLVSEDNIQLASSRGTSTANIVQLAIEAYDPMVWKI